MKNKTTSTPGPWIHSGGLKHNVCETFGVKKETGTWIALCHPFNGSTKDLEEAQKNSLLISAAPDLLEIAKLILKEWDAPTDGVQKGELIARLSQYAVEARAAIKKATGDKV